MMPTVDHTDTLASHPLASLDGIRCVVVWLLMQGALCPKCGHGTRVTGARWAKCKRCGTKVARNLLAEVPTICGGTNNQQRSGA